MMEKIIKKVKSILIRILYKVSPLLPSKLYLKLLFPLKVGYKLNFQNPKTYNEKLQWLKLNYINPIFPLYVDKYEFKQVIKEMFGEEYVVKNYGVWESFDEIDFDKLPEKFVLKTTHDQGGVVICHNKSNFDKKNAEKKLNNHLKRNLYYILREWPYKNIKPRIIAEEYIENTEKKLYDYKIYCFNGEPKLVFVASDRNSIEDSIFDFYDLEFNHLDIKRSNTRQSEVKHNKPKGFEKMLAFSSKLSQGLPHVRIDFYNIEGKIYFGEFTLFTGGGLKPFYPIEWDYKLGEWINLESLIDENITNK